MSSISKYLVRGGDGEVILTNDSGDSSFSNVTTLQHEVVFELRLDGLVHVFRVVDTKTCMFRLMFVQHVPALHVCSLHRLMVAKVCGVGCGRIKKQW